MVLNYILIQLTLCNILPDKSIIENGREVETSGSLSGPSASQDIEGDLYSCRPAKSSGCGDNSAITNRFQLDGILLKDLMLTLPIGYEDNPLTIYQPELQYNAHEKYFFVNESDLSLMMITPAGGVSPLWNEFPCTSLSESNNGHFSKWNPKENTHSLYLKLRSKKQLETIPEISVAEIATEEGPIFQIILIGNGSIFARNTFGEKEIGFYACNSIIEIKLIVEKGKVYVYINNASAIAHTEELYNHLVFFRFGSLPQSSINYGEDPLDFSSVAVYSYEILHQKSALKKRADNVVVPADILNLDNWTLTLPIEGMSAANIIKQPVLNTYYHSKYFYAKNNAVVLIANCGGATTVRSTYPRSELREMKANGAIEASWSAKEGKIFLNKASIK
jgi:hypothetical protein